MELGLIKHYRKRDMWFEIFKKLVFLESSNYRFLFCEWGMRCIFQSVRNTFTPASCYGIQIRPAIPHSSLVAAADAVFVSAFLKLWLPNLRKRPEIYVIFSRLMSQSGHVILSVQQGFACSFKWNQGHPRGQCFCLSNIWSLWNETPWISWCSCQSPLP